MRIKKFVGYFLTIVYFSMSVQANPIITCVSETNDRRIVLKLADEAFFINEEWNGFYKTTRSYKGTILPVFKSIILRFEERPYTTGILKINMSRNVGSLEFSGFLAPIADGIVDLSCY